MTPAPKAQLPDLLEGLHKSIENELGIARAVIGHSGTKGDVSEGRWTDMLAKYLPARYAVSKAFVIDSSNQCSDQIDVVVHDRQYSPFVFTMGTAHYVPAESVYAVFEVKQELSKEQLSYASDKVASVRRLHRTSVPIHHVDGVSKPKPPQHIIGGLLCLDSTWSPPFGDAFTDALFDGKGDRQLDLGCVAKYGLFEFDAGNPAKPHVVVNETRAPLASFLLRLIARLQSMATVPCLDVMAYARWANKL